MNVQDYVTEFYPRPETETRYCAICHYVENNLTHSFYVLNCENTDQALSKAELLFNRMAQNSKLCGTIYRIEILPKNAGRWQNVSPELVKQY